MATNFLEATGGSTAGYFSAVVTLISSEATSLGSSLVVTGATTFTSSGNFGQAIWGEVSMKIGTTFTPGTGAFIAGWFLRSPDGGTTFETVLGTSVNPAPRSPEFVIPISSAVVAGQIMYATGLVKMPWSPVKVLIQNSAGATLGASTTNYTTISLGPVAVQY